jgi:RNA polymerase sigma factor (sigma-70 family)
MNFYAVYKRIEPRLKKIAKRYNGHGRFIDEDDLYQEMCMHLWNKYKDDVPVGINEAYIIKGCEFHLLNYLRKEREKVSLISMEQPINENGDMVQDVLSDTNEPLDELADRKIKIDQIKNNSFGEKEKAVFLLLLKGNTIRETGRELGISHVMVLKHKKNLIKQMEKVTKIRQDLL